MSYYIDVKMKLKEVSVEAIEMVINRLLKEGKRTIFKQISIDPIDITMRQDKKKFINKFIEKKKNFYFSVENCMSYILSLTKDNTDYKWVKPGEIYFNFSTSESNLRYHDDPNDKDYKEMKKERDENTKEFLKILKIIYETLKPEYGWGDNELCMYDRGFDYKDVSKDIVIYGPELVKRIGVNKFEKLPVKAKIKNLDGGYIVLFENFCHYTPELREKIKKHLFG